MLPDFPEFKRQFRLALDNVVRSQAQSGALLRLPRGARHFEGSKHGTAGDATQLPYQQAEAFLTLSLKDIAEEGPELVLVKGFEAGTELRAQAEKLLMQVIRDVASEGTAGASVFSGPPTPESLLDAFEAAEVSFDSSGRSNFAIVAGSHDAYLALQKCQREIAENPKYEQRAKAIFERKHRDWISRTGDRGLAD